MPKKTEKEVEAKALQLSDTFKNHKYFPYYCKVAHRLTEHEIDTYKEVALRGNNPARYFTYLCNKAMTGGEDEQTT